jgi:hypothetical protein
MAKRRRTLARRCALCAMAGFMTFAQNGNDFQDKRAMNDEEPNVLVFARFKFKGHIPTPDEWDTLPSGDDNLLRFVARATNIPLSKKNWRERVVAVDDFEKMRTTPVLFMTGQVDFNFADEEIEAIGEYFKRGGFLYSDDCDADSPQGLYFYPAFLREMQRIPGLEVKPLPLDHEIYHCFYDFPSGSPWHIIKSYQQSWPQRYPDMGIFLGERMVSFLTANDQHCAWAGRRPFNQQEAFRMGTNIIVYALTH